MTRPLVRQIRSASFAWAPACAAALSFVGAFGSVAFASESGPTVEVLFERVTGVRPTNAEARELRQSFVRGDRVDETGLFQRLFSRPEFVDVQLASFVSQLSNEEGEPFADVDDYQVALILAAVGDGDFRLPLREPFYIAKTNEPDRPLPPNSTPYMIGATIRTMSDIPRTLTLRRAGSISDGGVYVDGLFASRGFGERFILGGTNRRPVRAAYSLFLCSRLESWADGSLPDDWVGRDVDRSPGDDPEAYQSRCRNCHAPMDSQRGAWARHDFRTGFQSGVVREDAPVQKMNQNESVYPNGFRTRAAYWENLLVSAAARERFGWRGPTRGVGVLSFSRMISDARQFQTCMAERVFQSFCKTSEASLRTPDAAPEMRRIADAFRSDGYRFRSLVRNVVRSPLCESH